MNSSFSGLSLLERSKPARCWIQRVHFYGLLIDIKNQPQVLVTLFVCLHFFQPVHESAYFCARPDPFFDRGASTLPGSKLYDFTTRSERSKYFTILCLKYLPFFAKHLIYVETHSVKLIPLYLPKRSAKLQKVGEQFILERVNAEFKSFLIKENDIGTCTVICLTTT